MGNHIEFEVSVQKLVMRGAVRLSGIGVGQAGQIQRMMLSTDDAEMLKGFKAYM